MIRLRPFRAHRELDADLAGPLLAAASAAQMAHTIGPTPEERRREAFGDLGPFRRHVSRILTSSDLLDAVYHAAWAEQHRRAAGPLLAATRRES